MGKIRKLWKGIRYLLGQLPDRHEAFTRDQRVWNAETDRRLNRLHRIVPESKFLRQLLLRVMREYFYRGGDDPDALAALALDRLEGDFRRMIFGDAPLMLDALHRRERSVPELRAGLQDALRRRCRTLAAGAWRELLAVPECRRRFVASPLRLQLNDLECYASPLLAYADRGRLTLVELRSGALDEYPEVRLMHRFHALNRSGRLPEAVVSRQLDPETGELRELAGDFDVAETLRAMTAEAAAHRTELTLDAAAIPVNTTNCGHCVFASYCGEKSQLKGDLP